MKHLDYSQSRTWENDAGTSYQSPIKIKKMKQ